MNNPTEMDVETNSTNTANLLNALQIDAETSINFPPPNRAGLTVLGAVVKSQPVLEVNIKHQFTLTFRFREDGNTFFAAVQNPRLISKALPFIKVDSVMDFFGPIRFWASLSKSGYAYANRNMTITSLRILEGGESLVLDDSTDANGADTLALMSYAFEHSADPSKVKTAVRPEDLEKQVLSLINNSLTVQNRLTTLPRKLQRAKQASDEAVAVKESKKRKLTATDLAKYLD